MYVYLHLAEIRNNYLTTPTTLLKEIIQGTIKEIDTFDLM